MGGSSSSTVNQKYNTSIINKSDIEVINKQLNEYSTDVVMNTAQNCSSGISQLQNISFRGAKVAGDFNLGEVNQNQTSAVTFDCVQADSVQNEIAQGFVSKMLTSLESKYDANIVDKLDAAASSEAVSGPISLSGADSDSTVNVDYNFESVTDTRKRIENVIQNSVSSNFEKNTISDCIAQTKQNQSMDFENIEVGGSVNIKALNQTQAADLMSKCDQKAGAISKITQQVVTDLGLEVKETASISKETSISSSAESKSASGILASCGSCPCDPSSCIVIIIIIIVVCVVGGFIVSGMQGGGLSDSQLASMSLSPATEYMALGSTNVSSEINLDNLRTIGGAFSDLSSAKLF
jgi:hypothetical protein